jgi:hypothetical protein
VEAERTISASSETEVQLFGFPNTRHSQTARLNAVGIYNDFDPLKILKLIE